MRESTRERLTRAVALSADLGEELLAAGFLETSNPRFSRSLLNAGSHCIKAAACYGRVVEGRPARQVRILRTDGSEVEPPQVEAPPTEFIRMERVRAILAGVEGLPIEVMAEMETESEVEQGIPAEVESL